MERNISFEEISDGRKYAANDMVKAGCNDCKGCSACCRGMGESIVLDPYDVFRLSKGLGMSIEQLISQKKLELNVVEGIILPNIAMHEDCGFLNEEGRCTIHEHRPGICRLFPLGRIYENGGFSYFLQVHECKNQNRTKVKVKQWIDTPNVAIYEQYIAKWHYFLKDVSEYISQCEDTQLVQKMNMYLLQLFFIKPYETTDFYGEFEQRFNLIKGMMD